VTTIERGDSRVPRLSEGYVSGENLSVLKVRDDDELWFRELPESGRFELQGPQPDWLKRQDGQKGHAVTELRSRVEPWLTALFQSEHLALLVGSGLTQAVHRIAAGAAAAGSMSKLLLSSAHAQAIEVAATEAASRAGRENGNVEDQLRVANELLRGLQILGSVQAGKDMKDAADQLASELDTALAAFARSILLSETGIARGTSRENAMSALVTFLMSFASRTGTRDRLHIFTTNYDRLLEAGAELAGIHLLDRFVGTLAPIFRSSRLDLDIHYNPPGIRGEPRYLEGVARFTKLHGSVDWLASGEDIRRIGVPFGAEDVTPFLAAPGLSQASPRGLMIYPNAAKDRETAEYPYVELFRDLAASICRPNSTLVTYGYSFGDEHINRVVRDMLTIPSTHLVIIAYGDPLGRIMREYKRIGRKSQVSLMVGPLLADLTNLTDYFLPKPAIDRTTFRMADLLRQRIGSEPNRGKAEIEAGGAQ